MIGMVTELIRILYFNDNYSDKSRFFYFLIEVNIMEPSLKFSSVFVFIYFLA